MLELATLIARQARYRPEVPAVVFEDRRLTYRQFWGRVARVGNLLHSLGDQCSYLAEDVTWPAVGLSTTQ